MNCCKAIYPSLCHSICLSVRSSFSPCVNPFVCSSVFSSIHPYICLSVHATVHLSLLFQRSVHLSVCLSICLYVCLSLRMSVSLSIDLTVCPSVRPSICLSIHSLNYGKKKTNKFWESKNIWRCWPISIKFTLNDNHDLDYVWFKCNQNPLKTLAIITFLLKSPLFLTARDDIYPKAK